MGAETTGGRGGWVKNLTLCFEAEQKLFTLIRCKRSIVRIHALRRICFDVFHVTSKNTSAWCYIRGIFSIDLNFSCIIIAPQGEWQGSTSYRGTLILTLTISFYISFTPNY